MPPDDRRPNSSLRVTLEPSDWMVFSSPTIIFKAKKKKHMEQRGQLSLKEEFLRRRKR